MMTFARVKPNKLGQPQRVTFGMQALEALDIQMPCACRLDLLENDVLRLIPDPLGNHVIRPSMGARSARATQAPYVAAPDFLTAVNDRRSLDRAPRHAEVIEGALYIHLHAPISEEEYRWRRWQSYTRSDLPMSPDEVLHLAQRRTENVVLPLSSVLLTALRAEADALKLTVPAYIAHVLESVDRTGVEAPTAQTSHTAGHMVRMARAADTPLNAEEMIARGIPPASDEAWLRARVAEGMSYAEMADTWGGSASVYSKWGRRFGIQRDRGAMMRRIWETKR